MDAMPSYDVEFAGQQGRRIEVVASSKGIWRWRFRCGRQPIAPGGGVQLFCEVPRIPMRPELQCETPDRPGWVNVECGAAAELIEIPTNWKDLAWATVRLPDGLEAGGELTVTFGSETYPCHAVAHRYAYAPVSWRVDYDAGGAFYRVWPPMSLAVVPGPAVKMTLVLPSTGELGQPLRTRGRAEDANSNPGATWGRPVQLTLTRDGEAVPGATAEITCDQQGRFDIDAFTPDQPGVYRVQSQSEGLRPAVSNAAMIGQTPGRGVFWGDAHAHSMWADGVGTIDENYRYARYDAMLDVFGLSEHLNNNVEFDTFPQYKAGTDWSLLGPHMADAVRRYHQPHRFVTLLAAEYSPSFSTEKPKGDFCIYSPGDDFGDMPMARECPHMLQLAKRMGCICIPHVGGHILPWEQFPIDLAVTPLLEIAAMHGHFERFAQEGLQQGHKMGFVGMADGHFGMPGYDNWALRGRTPKVSYRNYSSQSAITGFIADELTREGIFEAMRARRTYATSGQRVLLNFEIDESPMGSEIRCDGRPEIRIEVHGSAPIAMIELIRGDRRVLQQPGDGRWDITLDWTDPAPVKGETWYYLRATQEDSTFAWSSPIWVDCHSPEGISPDEANELPAWNDPPYWPPANAESVLPEHVARLAEIFEKRRMAGRFVDVEPYGLYHENRGRYAMFLAKDAELGDKTVHIHLFVDFQDDRLYIFEGVPDYGVIYKWE